MGPGVTCAGQQRWHSSILCSKGQGQGSVCCHSQGCLSCVGEETPDCQTDLNQDPGGCPCVSVPQAPLTMGQRSQISPGPAQGPAPTSSISCMQESQRIGQRSFPKLGSAVTRSAKAANPKDINDPYCNHRRGPWNHRAC